MRPTSLALHKIHFLSSLIPISTRNDARGAGGLVSSRGLQNILFVGSFNRVNEELA